MSTIHSRFSCGSGTTFIDCGVSAKICTETAETAKKVSWMLADRIAGLSLSDQTITAGIVCTVITCVVNWYHRQKERENRPSSDVTRVEK